MSYSWIGAGSSERELGQRRALVPQYGHEEYCDADGAQRQRCECGARRRKIFYGPPELCEHILRRVVGIVIHFSLQIGESRNVTNQITHLIRAGFKLLIASLSHGHGD